MQHVQIQLFFELHRMTNIVVLQLYLRVFSPVPVGFDEGKVGQQAVVRAASDRQGVVPTISVENVQSTAKAHGLRGAEAQFHRNALRSRTKLRTVAPDRSCGKKTRGVGRGRRVRTLETRVKMTRTICSTTYPHVSLAEGSRKGALS